jgi:hypothetical protein
MAKIPVFANEQPPAAMTIFPSNDARLLFDHVLGTLSEQCLCGQNLSALSSFGIMTCMPFLS